MSDSKSNSDIDNSSNSDARSIRIYKLTNNTNGKIYIGQTRLPYSERMQKGKGYVNSPYLFYALEKYGYENFSYETLAEFPSTEQKQADDFEAEAINSHRSKEQGIGYNLKEGGFGGAHSEESKRKIGAASKGHSVSEEARAKISAAHLGISKPKPSEEVRQKLGEIVKERHATQGHPFEGKHHTEEAKQAMSQKLKGRKADAQELENRRQARLKRMMPPEQQKELCNDYINRMTIVAIKEKYGIISNQKVYKILRDNNVSLNDKHDNWTGKSHNDNTKDKMSEARKQYWLDKKDGKTA